MSLTYCTLRRRRNNIWILTHLTLFKFDSIHYFLWSSYVIEYFGILLGIAYISLWLVILRICILLYLYQTACFRRRRQRRCRLNHWRGIQLISLCSCSSKGMGVSMWQHLRWLGEDVVEVWGILLSFACFLLYWYHLLAVLESHLLLWRIFEMCYIFILLLHQSSVQNCGCIFIEILMAFDIYDSSAPSACLSVLSCISQGSWFEFKRTSYSWNWTYIKVLCQIGCCSLLGLICSVEIFSQFFHCRSQGKLLLVSISPFLWRASILTLSLKLLIGILYSYLEQFIIFHRTIPDFRALMRWWPFSTKWRAFLQVLGFPIARQVLQSLLRLKQLQLYFTNLSLFFFLHSCHFLLLYSLLMCLVDWYLLSLRLLWRASIRWWVLIWALWWWALLRFDLRRSTQSTKWWRKIIP